MTLEQGLDGARGSRHERASPAQSRRNQASSAEARVIASFTFIVALLFGAWGAPDHLITRLMVEPEYGGIIVALMPFAATAVAFQAAKAAGAARARALGGATVMLGVLSNLGGVLYFVASY